MLRREIEDRAKQRKEELFALYKDYSDNLPDDIGPIPSCLELANISPVKAFVEENEARIPFSQERFDMVVPDAVEKYSTKARAELLVQLQIQKKRDVLRAYIQSKPPNQLEDQILDADDNSSGTDQRDSDNSFAGGIGAQNPAVPPLTDQEKDVLESILAVQDTHAIFHNQSIRHAISNDPTARTILYETTLGVNPAELLMATSFFRCCECSLYDKGAYMGFLDLKNHSIVHSRRLRPQSKAYSVPFEHAEKAREVLQALGLPEDTKYTDISGKILCMCAKPGFEQPATFSQLVSPISYHIRSL